MKRDFYKNIALDSFAVRMLTKCLPFWIPGNLRKEMIDALQGFNQLTAVIVADCLIDCMAGLGQRQVGDQAIDKLLRRLYRKILKSASSQGIKDLMFPTTNR